MAVKLIIIRNETYYELFENIFLIIISIRIILIKRYSLHRSLHFLQYLDNLALSHINATDSSNIIFQFNKVLIKMQNV